jgi:hypothetical protein
LDGLKNPTVKLFAIALMTTLAFGFFLLYTSKIRKGVGEEEVVADYRGREYVSFADDFRLIMKREAQTFICIAAIVGICFVLNTFDSLVFEKKTISHPTFFFVPMCMFATVINIPFVGYLLSAALESLRIWLFFCYIARRSMIIGRKTRAKTTAKSNPMAALGVLAQENIT